MRTIQAVRATTFAVALGIGLLFAGAAKAGTSTERPGSILMFPKVVQDGTRDTVIQIANTGNSTNYLHCFYLDGNSCVESDFELVLTKQQPTQWRVGEGRLVDLLDGFASPGSGLDPGLIPALPEGFEGALVCYEVSSSGEPVRQEKLKGEATLIAIEGDALPLASKYNAVAIGAGEGDSDGDAELALDGSEYAACSDAHQVNFVAQGAEDPVLGAGSSVVTTLTALPCSLDFLNGIPSSTVLNFSIYDEFEDNTSGGVEFECWGNFSLSSPDIPALGSPLATARITSEGSPVVIVGESFVTDSANSTAAAAVNLHEVGEDSPASIRVQSH